MENGNTLEGTKQPKSPQEISDRIAKINTAVGLMQERMDVIRKTELSTRELDNIKFDRIILIQEMKVLDWVLNGATLGYPNPDKVIKDLTSEEGTYNKTY